MPRQVLRERDVGTMPPVRPHHLPTDSGALHPQILGKSRIDSVPPSADISPSTLVSPLAPAGPTRRRLQTAVAVRRHCRLEFGAKRFVAQVSVERFYDGVDYGDAGFWLGA